MNKKCLLFPVLLIMATAGFAQAPHFSLSAIGGTEIAFSPVVDTLDAPPFKPGVKGEIQFDYSIHGFESLNVYANMGYGLLPTKPDGTIEISNLNRIEFSVGTSYRFPFGGNFALRVFADVGYYLGFFAEKAGGDVMFSTGLSAAYTIIPQLSLGLIPRYRLYAHESTGTIHSLDVLMQVSWHIDG